MEKPDSLSPPSPPTLRRRNSIATSVLIPTKLTLPTESYHTSSLPPQHTNGNTANSCCNKDNNVVSFELASFKSSTLSYTSLKDILPSTTVNSPTASALNNLTWGSAYEISIRNRLVKQAAWAYLQPMSSSPDSTGQHFLRRIWIRFSTDNPISACVRFFTLRVIPCITQIFDRIIRIILR